MIRARFQRVADWMIVLGAAVLLLSLFATWSHQLDPALLARGGGTGLLRDVPRDPTAWQVYSVADVLLALLAGALVAVALAGGRRARWLMLALIVLAVAFTTHALSRPPTNGVTIFEPSLGRYLAVNATAGLGETLGLLGLGSSLGGLLLSLATG